MQHEPHFRPLPQQLQSHHHQSPTLAQPQVSPQMHSQLSPGQTGSVTPGSESLAVDPGLEDVDEHPNKRQRLDENQDPYREDEAVMNALAAHNSGNVYGSE